MSSHSPSPSPSPWQPGIPLSVLVDLPVSDISYQWNHMRYGFLHLRNVWGFIHVVARVTLTDWIVSPPCICGPQTGYTGRHSESRTQFIVSKHPPPPHTHPAPRHGLHTWIPLPRTLPSSFLQGTPALLCALSSDAPSSGKPSRPDTRTLGACLLLGPPPLPGTSLVCSDIFNPVIAGFLSGSGLDCRLQEG